MGMTHSTIHRSGCTVSSYQRRFPVVYLLGGQCEGLELRIGNSRSALCSPDNSFLTVLSNLTKFWLGSHKC